MGQESQEKRKKEKEDVAELLGKKKKKDKKSTKLGPMRSSIRSNLDKKPLPGIITSPTASSMRSSIESLPETDVTPTSSRRSSFKGTPDKRILRRREPSRDNHEPPVEDEAEIDRARSELEGEQARLTKEKKLVQQEIEALLAENERKLTRKTKEHRLNLEEVEREHERLIESKKKDMEAEIKLQAEKLDGEMHKRLKRRKKEIEEEFDDEIQSCIRKNDKRKAETIRENQQELTRLKSEYEEEQDKYQRMLSKARKDFKDQNALQEAQDEILRLEKHMETKAVEFKEELEQWESMKARSADKFERELSEKEDEIQELKSQLASNITQIDQEKQRNERQLKDLQEELTLEKEKADLLRQRHDKKVSSGTKEVEELEMELELAQKDLSRERMKTKTAVEDLERAQTEINQLKEKNQQEQRDLVQKLQAADAELLNERAKVEKYMEELKAAESTIQTHEREIAVLKQLETKLEAELDNSSDMDRVKSQLVRERAKVEGFKNELKANEAMLKEIQTELEAARVTIQSHEKEIGILKQKETIESEMEGKEKEIQVLKVDFEAARIAIQERDDEIKFFKQIEKDLDTTRSAVEDREKQVAILQQNEQSLRDELELLHRMQQEKANSVGTKQLLKDLEQLREELRTERKGKEEAQVNFYESKEQNLGITRTLEAVREEVRVERKAKAILELEQERLNSRLSAAEIATRKLELREQTLETELRQENDRLEQEISSKVILETKVQHLTRELNDSRERTTILERTHHEKVSTGSRQVNDLEMELESVQQRMMNERRTNERFQMEIQEMKNEINLSTRRIEQQQSTIDRLEQIKETQRTELLETKSSLQDTEFRLSSLQIQHDQYEQQVGKYKVQIETLESRLRTLTSQMEEETDSLRQSLRSVQEENEQLIRRVRDDSSSIAQEATIRDLEAKVRQFQQSKVTMEAESRLLESELSSLREIQATIVADRDAMTDRAKELKIQLNEMDSQFGQVRFEKESLESDTLRLQQEKEQLTQQLNLLNRQAVQVAAPVVPNELQDQVREIQLKLANAEGQIEHLSSELHSLRPNLKENQDPEQGKRIHQERHLISRAKEMLKAHKKQLKKQTAHLSQLKATWRKGLGNDSDPALRNEMRHALDVQVQSLNNNIKQVRETEKWIQNREVKVDEMETCSNVSDLEMLSEELESDASDVSSEISFVTAPTVPLHLIPTFRQPESIEQYWMMQGRKPQDRIYPIAPHHAGSLGIYQKQIKQWAHGRQKVQRAALQHASWLGQLCRELCTYDNNN